MQQDDTLGRTTFLFPLLPGRYTGFGLPAPVRAGNLLPAGPADARVPSSTVRIRRAVVVHVEELIFPGVSCSIRPANDPG